MVERRVSSNAVDKTNALDITGEVYRPGEAETVYVKRTLGFEDRVSQTVTGRATAVRDLQELVSIGALGKTGTLKSTRYSLDLGK